MGTGYSPIGNNALPASIDPAEVYSGGFFDYNDTATASTPIAVPGTNTYVYLTNDGLGAFTNKTYKPGDITDIWDSVNNQFDFSQLSLGDTLDIRIDLEVTTSQPNQAVDVDLELAIGTGNEYDILFDKTTYKTAGAKDVNEFTGIYLGDTNTKNNPAKFKIRSDFPATVIVRGWYVRILKRG